MDTSLTDLGGQQELNYWRQDPLTCEDTLNPAQCHSLALLFSAYLEPGEVFWLHVMVAGVSLIHHG